ncbi:lipoprotein [Massilia sp. W12]|uniref:LPS translocon maturation chaperone LptM n=1 Tax=Massilia sp. W12 TaxID=3126507 RepID=UPI0030D56C58
MKPASPTLFRALPFGLALCLLAACGQRGPLYLPEPPKEAVEKKAEATGAARADDKKAAKSSANADVKQ